MEELKPEGRLRIAHLAVPLLLAGCVLFGFALDRYPGPYVDDIAFAFPALNASAGRTFMYAVSLKAPFGDQIWAYHGPVLPRLLELLFKVFGFHPVLARLPDFLGAWAAAMLLVIFLNRRGYRFAGFAFAVLWCGDRSLQEVMYARPEGLALLALAASFLLVRETWVRRSDGFALCCGLMCGLVVLIHPLCLGFTMVSLCLVAYGAGLGCAAWFCLGGVVDIVLLFALWGFRIRDSAAQFMWHVHFLKGEVGGSVLASLWNLVVVLRWSRYWFVALLLWAAAAIAIAATMLARHRRQLDARSLDFVLSAAFATASLQMLFRPSVFPYYLVYFTTWAMLALVCMAETHFRRMRFVALAAALVWCSSAAWNVARAREPILFYRQLKPQALYSEFRAVVPAGSRVVVTPETYSVPAAAGDNNFEATTFNAEDQDICPSCYLLMNEKDLKIDRIAPANLRSRRTLYAGPAFPGAGPLAYPIVILSPEEGSPP